METQQERLKNICDYIDSVVREDVNVFSIRIKEIKKDIERSLLKNSPASAETKFLIKHL